MAIRFMRKNKFDNFRHLMGKAASRKGMGMELALLVLFVVFACSILLVNSAMLGKSNLNERQDKMAQRFELDMFAEQNLTLPVGETHIGGEYDAKRIGDRLVIFDKEGQVVLTVYLSGNTITAWAYS